MFENAGEQPDGGSHQCEGDGDKDGQNGCIRWQTQKGETYDEKLAACAQCPKNCSPPIVEAEALAANAEFDAAVDDMVDQVEYLIHFENAGRTTDWSTYPFEIQKLFVIWRNVEKQIADLHGMRIQTYIKAKFTAAEA